MLQDSFERKFQYIRLSITERCNFRCQYCLPDGYSKTCSDSDLSLSEINNLVAALVDMGVWKIRLTGGEPTLRRDINEIIQVIKSYQEIKQIALTTNGYKLLDNIGDYHRNGLTNLNVSIDSLNSEQFKTITQVDKLDYILKSLESAQILGIPKIKINAVLLPHTIDELDLFLEYIKNRDLSVRFIELMQTSDNENYFRSNYVDAQTLKSKLIANGWMPLPREIGAGPATEYSHSEYVGKIGIIAPYSKDFCTTCNRLRITHKGELRLCLFGNENYNLRHLLKSKSQKNELQSAILDALTAKPITHELSNFKFGNIKNLSNVGG